MPLADGQVVLNGARRVRRAIDAHVHVGRELDNLDRVGGESAVVHGYKVSIARRGGLHVYSTNPGTV